DGVNAACPPDAVSGPGLVCRPAAGDCDVEEHCGGASKNCLADAVAGTSTVCRPPAGECDAAEGCDGTDVDCPNDVVAADGTACVDVDACTTDSCQSGVCVGVRSSACPDPFLCYKAKNTNGTPKLPTLTGPDALTLSDQFESASLDGDFFKSMCTPADTGEG